MVIIQINKNTKSIRNDIRAARIHKYGAALVIDNIRKPVITSAEEVVVKVGATGLCHSDLHLINGDWQRSLPLDLPKTSGHEIAGWVEETGVSVPNRIKRGDLVAVKYTARRVTILCSNLSNQDVTDKSMALAFFTIIVAFFISKMEFPSVPA